MININLLMENKNSETTMEDNNYHNDEVDKYIIEVEKYAVKIGVNTDAIIDIKYNLIKNLNKDNEWCLFHETPSYWINHHLVCLDIESKILYEYHHATWDDIDILKINNNAKEKIKSIRDCPKCKIHLCSELKPEQCSEYFPRRAMQAYFFDNELYAWFGNKWVEEIGICKHYLVDD